MKCPHKEIYPILGYDGKGDPKFLVGGFGIGRLRL